MKTTLIKSVKTEEFACPTIVKVSGDYYVVSKKYYPTTRTDNGKEKYIVINLTKGEWFDWGEEIPKFSQMETFEKGTKFEIEI